MITLGTILAIVGVIFLIYILHLRAYLFGRKKFVCMRCGHCCRLLVKLSKEDIIRLNKKGESDFIGKKGYMRQVNGYCKFLNLKRGVASCSVYDSRPKICRTFPIRIGLLGRRVDLRCRRFLNKFF